MINKLLKLNKATKIFFVILFFGFLVSIIVSERDFDLTVLFLGIIIGALLGFVYFYGIGRLEIHKGEKYGKASTLLSKNVDIKITGYYLVSFLAFLGAGINFLIGGDFSELTFFLLFMAIGLIIPLLFFINTRRINPYKTTKKEQSDDD
ncbi:MAG: hypothetical protein U9N35_03415 [Euryarchaeota archaeon]|nr:hypothetical protein [Euryarchaeota archaeon]